MPNKATGGPVGNAHKRTYLLDAASTAVIGQGVIKGLLDTSVANPSGAGQRCEGVVDFVPFGTSVALSIVRKGECLAICGAGGVNRGDYVKMDATGLFVAATTTADEVVGRAVTSATTSGDEFILDVDPFVF